MSGGGIRGEGGTERRKDGRRKGGTGKRQMRQKER